MRERELDLRVWASRNPDRLAVRCDAETVSFGELEALSNRVAHVLRDHGVRRGDHVAVAAGNDVIVFALIWGAYRVGAYLTPMPTTSSAEDAAYIVQDSGARIVVVNAASCPDMVRLPDVSPTGPTWLSVRGQLPGFMALEPLLAQAPATPVAAESSGALMMYTSGTTGRPKAVWRPLPQSRQPCPAFAADLIALFHISSDSKYLSTAPLYHAAPLRFGLSFLAAGGSVVVMPTFSVELALGLLESERITHSQWVPTMFKRLLEVDEVRRSAFRAPAHRTALHAAAPCPLPIKRAMIDWWGPILEEYYSGTEGVGLTALSSQEWLAHPGSVGRAKKGTLHVLGDGDEELPAASTGRIFFSGTAPFKYLHAPDKTAARTSSQGWQTFGDVGHVDAEGYLYLTDRLDDMIISGGVNIYPQELENALVEHEEISDAAVIGVPDPDFGERPIAFVVPRAPDVDPTALLVRLEDWALRRLGRVKRPKEIRLIADLPYSAQGKLLRRELRRRLELP